MVQFLGAVVSLVVWPMKKFFAVAHELPSAEAMFTPRERAPISPSYPGGVIAREIALPQVSSWTEGRVVSSTVSGAISSESVPSTFLVSPSAWISSVGSPGCRRDPRGCSTR